MRSVIRLSLAAAAICVLCGCGQGGGDPASWHTQRALEKAQEQNAQLAAAQQQALAQLEQERARQKALQDEASTTRSLQQITAATVVVLGCGLAVTLWVLRRKIDAR